MMLYNSTNFHENILKVFQLIDRKIHVLCWMDRQTDRQPRQRVLLPSQRVLLPSQPIRVMSNMVYLTTLFQGRLSFLINHQVKIPILTP